jgi:hypothetical protein
MLQLRKRAQFKAMESIIALAFIIIILALVGVFIAKSQMDKAQSGIADSKREQLAKGALQVLALPDFRCTGDIEYYCVDLQKVLAIKEISQEDAEYRSFLRTTIGMDCEIRVISTFPEDFNITFFNSTVGEYKTKYMLNIPILISNESNYYNIGFGVLEVKGYLK